jgi:hypothetical protein
MSKQMTSTLHWTAGTVLPFIAHALLSDVPPLRSSSLQSQAAQVLSVIASLPLNAHYPRCAK